MGRRPKSSQFYNGMAVTHDGRNINELIRELERAGDDGTNRIYDGPHIGDGDHQERPRVPDSYDNSAGAVSEGSSQGQ